MPRRVQVKPVAVTTSLKAECVGKTCSLIQVRHGKNKAVQRMNAMDGRAVRVLMGA